MSKIIAIHSFRGGTGKSNLTANLAVAMALQEKRVAIVDTDLQSPGIHALFGIDKTITGKTLNDYLWNRSCIEDTACDVTSHLAISQGTVFLIPSSINADEIAKILSEGYNVSLLNTGFQRLIKELKLDYLFIDTHPGLSRETLLCIAISDLLIIILRPDRQDFQGTAVTVNIARQLQVREMMMVINKIPNRMNFASLQQKVEKTYNVPVAGILPLSEDMAQLGSSGIFCLQYPDHPFTQTLQKLADKVS
ncbi:MinD/ParA family ATP-binding protein [Anabaena sp. FACHB-709]|uniref:Cell division inhibitor MinD n=2 Tax=Nostocaceae TaxID=1162 RepID=A0A1Z4KHG4_ANAVA|nr:MULTISPECIES: MinD/ParA family protein [Nostocaceae]BAY68420.1 cell division inhibitor MinD [Trichormus variabilis NIES-23]HBW32689.1 MinD/ParA family protein [Nostoc sp. UBA8866]MBD2171770.1 MinD/ParA family protein [Anabaena cylindrica FACHB-318]MBD2264288.1 MinD/ParA family protein [Anabaena sp. FACHB-709]MBD2273631.1 MinD/ParA family protein [Nostoc sp. PCC 7120 = FACHB-418]